MEGCVLWAAAHLSIDVAPDTADNLDPALCTPQIRIELTLPRSIRHTACCGHRPIRPVRVSNNLSEFAPVTARLVEPTAKR